MAAASSPDRLRAWRLWPLRRLVIAWALVVGAALAGMFTLGALRGAEEAAWRRASAMAATELARLTVVSERLMLSDSSVVSELALHATLDPGTALVVVVDPQAVIHVSSRAVDLRRPLAQAYPQWAGLIGRAPHSDQTVTVEDKAGRRLVSARGFAWPAASGEIRGSGNGTIILVTDVERLYDAQRRSALQAQAAQIAVLLAAGALLLLALDRLVLRPLATLRQAATRLGEGHLQHRVPEMGVRELNTLGQSLNGMGESLQASAQRMSDSEQRFRDLAVSAPDAIITTDEEGRIDQFNLAAERLFGYAAADVAGQPLACLLPEGDRAAHPGHLAAFLRADAPAARRMSASRQVGGRHRDGHRLALEVGISRSAVGGRVSFTAVIRDVSERVAAEAELDTHRRHLEELVRSRTAELLLERDRALAATRAKSEFLANMDHEIRTPLNAIIGLAHVAARDADPKSAAHLGRIEAAAQGLRALIGDVLDFTRLEAGRMSLLLAEAELWPMVHAVCEPLAIQAATHGVELLEWIDADLPATVQVDELRLRHVLGHLVGNAVKFTSSGHVLVRVRPGAGPGALRFEVSDTGIGVMPEVLQRLLSPFEPGDDGDTQRFAGAGLGLIISQRLLRLMDSRLQASSVAGQGATFWFDLPGVMSAAVDRAPSPPAPVRRALVVDASHAAAQAARAVMRVAGYLPSVAGSGDDAVAAILQAQAEGRPFELCLIDAGPVRRTGRDSAACEGFELGRRIDALGLAQPPERMLTAREGAPLVLSEVMRQGFLGVLHKPLAPAPTARRLAARHLAPEAPTPELPETAAPADGADERAFAQAHRHDARRMRYLATHGHVDELRAMAYSLQLAAAAIGAHAVESAAAVLQREARPPEALIQDCNNLVSALNARMRDIGFDRDEQPEIAALPLPLDARALLNLLPALLARRDMSAWRAVQEHGRALREALGPSSDALLAAISDFDFDGALALLGQEAEHHARSAG